MAEMTLFRVVLLKIKGNLGSEGQNPLFFSGALP
jgi:hypothetical protein